MSSPSLLPPSSQQSASIFQHRSPCNGKPAKSLPDAVPAATAFTLASVLQAFKEAYDQLSFPAVDLDEGLNGIVAARDKLVDLYQRGITSIYAGFEEDVLLLKSSATGFISSMIAPDDSVDFYARIIMGLGVVGLAQLAVNGGQNGAEEAVERTEQLKKSQKRHKDTAESLEIFGEKWQDVLKLENTQLDIAKLLNNYDKNIAASSIRSGTAIRNKTLVELGAQLTLVAMTGTFAVKTLLLSGTAATLPTVFAFATAMLSLVLGIWAAVSAVRLGMVFDAKTQKIKEHARKEYAAIEGYEKHLIESLADYKKTLANYETGIWQKGSMELALPDELSTLRQTLDACKTHWEEHSQATKHYLSAAKEELLYRKEFADYFAFWNRGFRASATLYAGSTILQSGLVTLPALIGCTALATPPVLGALFVGNIVGGISMMFASHQFWSMPHAQQHFDAQRDMYMFEAPANKQAPVQIKGQTEEQALAQIKGQDEEKASFSLGVVDRSLIVATHVFLTPNDSIELQAAALKRIDTQDHARREFLQKVAEQTEKNYDTREFRWQSVSKRRENAPGFSGSYNAARRTIGAAAKIFTNPMNLVAHLKNARQTWSLERNALTSEALNAFLEKEESLELQSRFISEFLKAELDYLTLKNRIYTKIEAQTLGFFAPDHAESKKLATHISGLISEFSENNNVDQLLSMRRAFINMQRPKTAHAHTHAHKKSSKEEVVTDEASKEKSDFAKISWKPDESYADMRGVQFLVSASLASYTPNALPA